MATNRLYNINGLNASHLESSRWIHTSILCQGNPIIRFGRSNGHQPIPDIFRDKLCLPFIWIPEPCTSCQFQLKPIMWRNRLLSFRLKLRSRGERKPPHCSIFSSFASFGSIVTTFEHGQHVKREPIGSTDFYNLAQTSSLPSRTTGT